MEVNEILCIWYILPDYSLVHAGSTLLFTSVKEGI